MAAKIFGILVCTLLSFSNLHTQETWINEYGGSGDEIVKSVIQSSDGNYVLFGSSNATDNGDYDFYLLKINQSGQLLWEKRFGGLGDQYGVDILENSEHQLVLLGRTELNEEHGSPAELFITDSEGNILIEKSYGDATFSVGELAISALGDMYIGGSIEREPRRYDITIVKIDAEGDTLWSKNLNTKDNIFNAFSMTSSDDLVVLSAERYETAWMWREYILRLHFVNDTEVVTDTMYTVSWGRVLGVDMIEVSEDHYAIIVNDYLKYGDLGPDCGLIITDGINPPTYGPLLWFWLEDAANALTKDENQNLYLAMTSMEYGSLWVEDPLLPNIDYWTDMRIVKVNSENEIEWTKTFGDSAHIETANDIIVSDDRGLLLVGTSDSNIIVVKTNANGVVTGIEEEEPKSISSGFKLLQNYPNPFNPVTSIRYELPKSEHVTLRVFNITGQLVAELVNESKSAGYHDVEWDASSVASGVYIYTISVGSSSESKKMVVMK